MLQVMAAACLHLACTSEDAPVRINEVARAVHDVFYNFSHTAREQMLNTVSTVMFCVWYELDVARWALLHLVLLLQGYMQKLHDALVKAERALCYVLGFELESVNGYMHPENFLDLVNKHHLTAGYKDVPQVAWDFILLRYHPAWFTLLNVLSLHAHAHGGCFLA